MGVYTTCDDDNLVSYISENRVGPKERLKLGIYKDLVAEDNAEKWPWSRRHSAESWLSRYRTRQAYFDSRIESYIQPKDKSCSSSPIATLEEASHQSKFNQELFTEEDSARLVKPLADLPRESSPEPWTDHVHKDTLMKNSKTFPWSVTHDGEVWRNLYLSHRDEFDAEMAELRRRDNTQSIKRLLPEESEEESDIETQPAKKPRISPQPADPSYTEPQNSDHLVKRNYTSIKSAPLPHTQEENRSPRASLASGSFTTTRSEASSPTYDDTVSHGRHAFSPIVSPFISARGPAPHSEMPMELEAPNDNCITQRLSSDERISLPQPPALPKLKPKKTPSVPELSEEDPFGSVPSSPKSTSNVFYKPPRPRPYAGFRDTARVRDRVFVNGPIVPMRKKQKISHIDRNQEDLPTTVAEKSDDNVSGQPTSANMKTLLAARQPSAMTSMTSQRETQQFHPGKHDVSKPATMVKKAVHVKSVHDGTPVDVFGLEARALTTTPDRYVLNTSHLTEPQTAFTSSDSPSSSILLKKYSQKDLKSRRRTFGGFSSGLPHINLLEKLPKCRKAGSPIPVLRCKPFPAVSKISHLIASDHKPRLITYTTPAHLHNKPTLDQAHALANLSPASYNLILGVGLDTLFKQLEGNHGFSQDVIRRIWEAQNMDFHATDRILLRMRIAAERAAAQTDGEGETNPAPVAASSFSLRRDKESVREPAEPRDEYTPPAKTKAFGYQRLSEQRHKERMEGELHPPQSVIPATRSSSHKQGSRNLVSPATPPEVILIEPKSKRRSIATVSTNPEIVDNKLVQDVSPVKDQVTAPVWGEKEEEALQSNEEKKLKELAERFGEGFLLQRFLANIGI